MLQCSSFYFLSFYLFIYIKKNMERITREEMDGVRSRPVLGLCRAAERKARLLGYLIKHPVAYPAEAHTHPNLCFACQEARESGIDFEDGV